MSSKENQNTFGCCSGLLVVLIIFCQPWFFQPWLWVAFAILSITMTVAIIAENKSSNDQITDAESNSNNYQGNQSSNNSQTIDWREVDINTPTVNLSTDIQELLNNLIGQKDRVTGQVFKSGEQVYFCIPCQLGYHKDSWEFLNQKCEQCSSYQAGVYTLPLYKFNQQVNQVKNNFDYQFDLAESNKTNKS